MHSGRSGGVPHVGCTACWLWRDCSGGAGCAHVPGQARSCAVRWAGGAGLGPLACSCCWGRGGRWGRAGCRFLYGLVNSVFKRFLRPRSGQPRRHLLSPHSQVLFPLSRMGRGLHDPGLTSHLGAGLPGGCGTGRGQPKVPQVNGASEDHQRGPPACTSERPRAFAMAATHAHACTAQAHCARSPERSYFEPSFWIPVCRFRCTLPRVCTELCGYRDEEDPPRIPQLVGETQ